MEKIKVMVLSKIGDENLERIRKVSSRIEVNDATKIWDMPDIGGPEGDDDCTDPEYEAMLSQAEILYGFRFPPNVLSRAPKVKWLQALVAGVELVLTDEMVKSRVVITNMSGVNAQPVIEVALELMLMMAKQAPFCIQSKRLKRWERYMPLLFGSQTISIIGAGHIGGGIARLAKAFGTKVLAADIKFKKKRSTRYIDTAYPMDQVHTMIADCDYVVLALPFTKDTNKLFGEKEFRSMKPTAYFINVGRGRTVDQEALMRALEEGRIAGAGMDVLATEPLPPENKLWEMENVFFSPHVAGRMPMYNEKATDLFCENLKRYIAGKRLINTVNKKKGF